MKEIDKRAERLEGAATGIENDEKQMSHLQEYLVDEKKKIIPLEEKEEKEKKEEKEEKLLSNTQPFPAMQENT